MKKSIITAIAATIALTSASTFAYAAKDGDKRGPNIERMLERLDTNNDGGISLEEVKAHQANLFTQVDANNDSSLTEEEFAMIKDIRKAEREANKPEGTETADKGDKDGKRKGKRGKRGPSFDRLDADNSGNVTLEEFASQAEKMFERMDRNEDGVINADDMKRKKS